MIMAVSLARHKSPNSRRTCRLSRCSDHTYLVPRPRKHKKNIFTHYKHHMQFGPFNVFRIFTENCNPLSFEQKQKEIQKPANLFKSYYTKLSFEKISKTARGNSDDSSLLLDKFLNEFSVKFKKKIRKISYENIQNF